MIGFKSFVLTLMFICVGVTIIDVGLELIANAAFFAALAAWLAILAHIIEHD